MSGDITGVYYGLNTRSNKIYIGASRDVASRFKSHLSALRADRHANKTLQADWNCDGESAFEWALLTSHIDNWPMRKLLPLGNLYELERFFIRLYQTTDSRYGYNCDHSAKALRSAQYRKPHGPIRPNDMRLKANRH